MQPKKLNRIDLRFTRGDKLVVCQCGCGIILIEDT